MWGDLARLFGIYYVLRVSPILISLNLINFYFWSLIDPFLMERAFSMTLCFIVAFKSHDVFAPSEVVALLGHADLANF